MPKLEYPARWVPRNAEETLFSAYDPGSPSTFDAQLTVNGRTLGVDESLEQARAGRGLNLATSLPGFRELSAEEMMVYRNQPALVSTYAYIVDPTARQRRHRPAGRGRSPGDHVHRRRSVHRRHRGCRCQPVGRTTT